MGIQGLLPAIKSSLVDTHISQFKGKRIGIDGYSWLHKGVYGCCYELCMNQPTDKWIKYFLSYIELLLKYSIEIYLIFDGENLPSKQKTEKSREENRINNLNKGLELLKSSNSSSQAYNYFSRAVDITPLMAGKLIHIIKNLYPSIKILVAPYEADAQISYLFQINEIDLVISEDSDNIPYGSKEIIFKLDKNTGKCSYLNTQSLYNWKDSLTLSTTLISESSISETFISSDLDLLNNNINSYSISRTSSTTSSSALSSSEINLQTFTLDMIKYMCILSGCDYLDSLKGIGLKKSYKLILLSKNNLKNLFSILKVKNLLPILPSEEILNKINKLKQQQDELERNEKDKQEENEEENSNSNLNLTNELISSLKSILSYEYNFYKALLTFNHQIVYDPIDQKLKHLNPIIYENLPESIQFVYCNLNKNNWNGNLSFLGSFYDNNIAKGVAEGKLDPITKQPFNLYDEYIYGLNNKELLYNYQKLNSSSVTATTSNNNKQITVSNSTSSVFNFNTNSSSSSYVSSSFSSFTSSISNSQSFPKEIPAVRRSYSDTITTTNNNINTKNNLSYKKSKLSPTFNIPSVSFSSTYPPSKSISKSTPKTSSLFNFSTTSISKSSSHSLSSTSSLSSSSLSRSSSELSISFDKFTFNDNEFDDNFYTVESDPSEKELNSLLDDEMKKRNEEINEDESKIGEEEDEIVPISDSIIEENKEKEKEITSSNSNSTIKGKEASTYLSYLPPELLTSSSNSNDNDSTSKDSKNKILSYINNNKNISKNSTTISSVSLFSSTSSTSTISDPSSSNSSSSTDNIIKLDETRKESPSSLSSSISSSTTVKESKFKSFFHKITTEEEKEKQITKQFFTSILQQYQTPSKSTSILKSFLEKKESTTNTSSASSTSPEKLIDIYSINSSPSPQINLVTPNKPTDIEPCSIFSSEKDDVQIISPSEPSNSSISPSNTSVKSFKTPSKINKTTKTMKTSPLFNKNSNTKSFTVTPNLFNSIKKLENKSLINTTQNFVSPENNK